MIPDTWLWVFGALSIALLFHFFWFVTFPIRVLPHLVRGNPKRQQTILEWINATPSLFGDAIKVAARHKLMLLYVQQARHADVERLCRAILAHRLPVGLESSTRNRLTDALEGLGRRAEADSERERAELRLEGAPEGALEQLTRAKLLMKRDQHVEAVFELERGLALVAPENRAVQVEFQVQLVMATFHAGRPNETAQWAERAIANGASGPFLSVAHRMAGVAYGNLGDWEAAERHRMRAYELATASGDSEKAAECFVQLADLRRTKGDLVSAEASCRQIISTSAKARRNALTILAEIQRTRGNFEEALEALRQARLAQALVIPALERRSQAVISLTMAWIEAEADQVHNAWNHLQQALSELGEDAKLGLWCDATAAWVFALLGQTEKALQILERAETRDGEFANDRTAQLNFHALLGKAAAALGDFERGKEHWEQFLALGPNRVNLPSGWYFLGESQRQLGDLEAARAAFQEACAFGVESYHAQLAKEKLSTLQ